jgi:hypothetical protein
LKDIREACQDDAVAALVQDAYWVVQELHEVPEVPAVPGDASAASGDVVAAFPVVAAVAAAAVDSGLHLWEQGQFW